MSGLENMLTPRQQLLMAVSLADDGPIAVPDLPGWPLIQSGRYWHGIADHLAEPYFSAGDFLVLDTADRQPRVGHLTMVCSPSGASMCGCHHDPGACTRLQEQLVEKMREASP